MDKIKKYSKIIQEDLEKRVAIPMYSGSKLKGRLVVNQDATEFIWLNVGWEFPKFIHGVVVHIALEDNKVRFFANNTDIEFCDVFVEKGIPKSDMVVEFIQPIERGLEYAQS